MFYKYRGSATRQEVRRYSRLWGQIPHLGSPGRKCVKDVKILLVNRDTARLGPKVRAVRRERGLTQVELARRLEISPSYLNLIEHGQRSLTAALLLRLAKELGLDLEAFTPESDQQLVG